MVPTDNSPCQKKKPIVCRSPDYCEVYNHSKRDVGILKVGVCKSSQWSGDPNHWSEGPHYEQPYTKILVLGELQAFVDGLQIDNWKKFLKKGPHLAEQGPNLDGCDLPT